jgi:hypothetical protein
MTAEKLSKFIQDSIKAGYINPDAIISVNCLSGYTTSRAEVAIVSNKNKVTIFTV